MALPPPPAGLDLSATQAPTILGVSIATYLLALIAVGLRIYCRRLLAAKLWWDDYLMFVALAAGGGMLFVVDCWMIPNGLGKHVWATPEDSVLVWAHGLFIEEIFYTVCLVTIKWSILCFYWRLFNRSKIRIPIFVIAGIVAAWGLAVIFTTIFQCVPSHAFWDKANPAIPEDVRATYQCNVDDEKFFIGNSVPNFLTDIAILCLPIPSIWALQLPTSKRLAVISILMLGVFVVAVSITRFVYVVTLDLNSPDITWNFTQGQFWSNIECYIGIVCGCLPSLGPLFAATGVSAFKQTQATYKMQSGGTHPHTLDTSNSRLATYQELEPSQDGYNHSFAYSSDGNGLGKHSDVEMGKKEGITVRTDLSVRR